MRLRPQNRPGRAGRFTQVAAAMGVAIAPLPITAFAADGFTATYPSVPAGPALLESFLLTRTGYDSTATLGTRQDTAVITYRKRQVYPNDASLTASDVVLSTWVASDDVATGVTNNSLLVSPAPVCNWIMPDRLTVGNTVELELTAWHWAARLGKQVAAVKFIATDGTTTVSQVVSAAVASNRTGDKTTVESYKCSLDISTLTGYAVGVSTGVITVNAEVYPWVGTDALGSVAKSTSSAVAREFSPRYFLKDATRVSAPPLAVCTTIGDDATGKWSTTYATAAAFPFATPMGALAKIDHATQGLGAGTRTDGAKILLGPGAFAQGTAPAVTRVQKCGALIITRDPNTTTTSADATLTWASPLRARLGVTSMDVPTATGALLIEDITINRTGAATWFGEAACQLEVKINNCPFNNGSQTAVWLSNAHDYHYGTVFTNLANGPTGAGTYEHRIYRGCSGAFNGNVEGWLVIGGSWKQVSMAWGARSSDGSINAFNKFMEGTGEFWGVAVTVTKGIVLASNIIEAVHTTSSFPNIGVSRDGSTVYTNQVILVNNTILGAEGLGRANLFYDDGAAPNPGAHRVHTFFCVKGNIFAGVYVKGDQFVGTNNNASPNPTEAANRNGHFPFMYGVNCSGNAQQWQTTANVPNSSEGPIYAGAGSIRPAAGVYTRYDMLFSAYAATTGDGAGVLTAGAGNGTYTLTTGSPAASILADPVLSLTLDGVARQAANDHAGALAKVS